MASYIAILQNDLANGFSKRELEVLIGLPKNSLASILTGKRNLSLKSQLKIKRWEASEKPNPLDIGKYDNDISKIDSKAGDMQVANKGLHDAVLEQIKKNSIPENKLRVLAERNTPHNLGDKNSQPVSATDVTYFLSDHEIRLMEDRIKVLEAELKSPPKTASIGVKTWIKIRERELSELKAKLNH